MKNKYIILGLVGIVIIVGFAIVLNIPGTSENDNGVKTEENGETNPNGQEPDAEAYVSPENGMVSPVVPLSAQSDYIIDITTAGFSPAELTIKKGESIIWTNRSKAGHWIEPIGDNIYPEEGDCGSKLDSCVALRLGESFKVTFNVAGVWGFHDKLNPEFSGTITVE